MSKKHDPEPMIRQAWKCHKIVHAAKIVEIRDTLDSDPPVLGGKPDVDIGKVAVLSDGTPIRLGHNITSRGMPSLGDYYVIYSQGTPEEYHSISPAKAFEDGYESIDVEIKNTKCYDNNDSPGYNIRSSRILP